MALLDYRFSSAELGSQIAISVALPDEGIDLPVLYLLHGRGDDHTAWTRQTGIERYAAERGLAVIMPGAELSYYRNEVHGRRYWSFLVDELPAACARLLPISTLPADTFVAGLSMGGYGAAQWALRRPESVAACASLSGRLDIAELDRDDPTDPGRRQLWDRIFGPDDLHDTDADLLWLLRQRPAAQFPALYVGCGLDDPMLASSRAFVAAAQSCGVAVDVDLRPGTHDWAYWDRAIQDVLTWLPVRR